MSNLKDFNWTGFWKDTDYAFESYIGREVTDEDIKNAEAELGYTLPAAYIELLKNHNGGVVNKNCFINDDDDCVYITGIYGIDRDKKYSLLGEMGNEFWISKVKYPPWEDVFTIKILKYNLEEDKMSEFKLTSVEEFEQATNELLENGAKVGADAWQFRVKNQTPHCKFGEQGTCCRICTMGPCRITPKAPRGICGCDVHGIVGRNFLRFTAGGSATHSDHGREICHTLHEADPNGNYKVKDPEKLLRIAKEWGVETEGKDIYDLAHEMAETGLMEYGKPFGYQRFLDRMPAGQKEKLIENEIAPRAIDREVSTSLHMAHMGCSSLPEALVKQSIRCGLADGWGGSMMGTEFSDVLFGTPKPIDTEANLLSLIHI